MKATEGDFTINNQVDKYNNQQIAGGFSTEELLKSFQTDTKDTEIIKKDPNLNSAIPIQYNADGSLKYTFDNIYKNKQLASVARDYYSNKDKMTFESGMVGDKQAIDKFISDRTWAQANTYAMGKEYLYVTGDNITQDQKARLSYLSRYWDELPNFYEEGGLGAKQFFKNAGLAVIDPLNIFGGFVGGRVASTALKAAGKQAIKSEVKKGVVKKTIKKEVLNSAEDLAKLSKQANRNALLKGSGSMALVDGAGLGTMDIANQLVEKEIGLREKLDAQRVGTVALTATGIAFFAGVGGGYAGNKLINLKLAKNKDLPTKKLKDASKKDPDNTNQSEAINNPAKKNFASTVRTNLADQWDFVKVLQKEINDAPTSVADLKKAYASKKFKVDPILEPYFQLRQLSASSTRAHSFIMEGVYMPPAANAKSASYIKGNSKGLHEILKPFDNNNEVDNFLNYVAAKRQNFISKKKPSLEKTLPQDKELRQQYIDFAEMTPSAYKKKYNETLTRKSNFTGALDAYKKFTDELLEYQVRSGLIDPKEAKRILKSNPFFIPLTRETGPKVKTIIEGVKDQTQRLLGVARPGAKQLATQRQEGTINLYKNLVNYTYQTVLSGDKNRAKLALYNMLEKGNNLGKIDMDSIVKKVGANRRVDIRKISTENIAAAYKKAGARFTVKNKPSSVDVLTFSDTFRPPKGASDVEFIDVVYRNGKAEYYDVLHPNLVDAYKGIGEDAMDFGPLISGPGNFFTKYSRVASRAITYSPPFVAFNAIRDTLAGTINSAFGISSRSLPKKVGYLPGYTTAKGYKEAFLATQQYKEALLNGMGYSSRSEGEKAISSKVKDLVERGAKLGVDSDVPNYYAKTLKGFFGKYAGGGWRTYKQLVQATEYATRMGEYQLAKAAGFSDIAASFAGREIATDFGMRGSSKILNVINKNTMFFNASIQGLYRTSRVFFEQPARAAGLVSTTIVAPSVALYYLNSIHDEYALVPDRIKQLNYVIPNYTTGVGPFTFGKKVLDPDLPFYLIPKPYDLGIFANIAEGLIDGMNKNSSDVTKRYIAASWSQITPGVPIPTFYRGAIEMLLNKNFYTGAPVIGMYEIQRIDELQARGTTREIAKYLSNLSSNFKHFVMRRKEGTVKSPILTPIEIDYLFGAYATGILSYPINILENYFKGDPLSGEKVAKRADQEDFSSFKNALSIITRRFKVAGPIKNSEYHKIWSEIIAQAKKLKQIDVTQTDLDKSNQFRINTLFNRILKNLDEDKPIQEAEIDAFSGISKILNEVNIELQESRAERNNIASAPYDAETKRELIDNLIRLENLLLLNTIDYLAEMEIEYIFDKTFGIATPIIGPAEDSVKKNPRRK